MAADVDYDAVEFLNRVLREGHRVTFDHDRRIEKEYQKCLEKVQQDRKGGSVALKKWFKTVVNRLAQKYSGKLQGRHRVKFKELKFDPSDWPFVAVCANTKSKNLVSKDSDYTKEIKEYLQKEMKICVLSIQDSLMIDKRK